MGPDLLATAPATFDGFLSLRDQVFSRRQATLLHRHELEKEAWTKKRWEHRPALGR